MGSRQPMLRENKQNGAIAQLVERVVRNDEVSGSIPLSSTIFHAVDFSPAALISIDSKSERTAEAHVI